MLTFARRGVLSCVALLCLAWLCSTVPAWAQIPFPKGAETELAKYPPRDISATVVSVEPGKLLMKNSSGEQYAVEVYDKFSNIEVTGKAKFEFLRAGVFVRFTVAELDKKGNASGDISGLTVCSADDLPSSVESDDLEGTKGPWLVTGQIKQIAKTGKASVAAGTMTVKLQFPVDIDIEIACREYSLAQEGDTATVNGHEVLAPDAKTPGRFVAVKLDIQLVEPIGAPPKKAKKPGKPAKTPKGKPEKPKDPFNQGE